MANNRFFDEDNIIKKNEKQANQEIIQNNINAESSLPENSMQVEHEEEPKKERKRKSQKIVSKNQDNKLIDSETEYNNIVQAVIDAEPELKLRLEEQNKPSVKITMDVQPPEKNIKQEKNPVYIYSRNEDGKPKIEPKQNADRLTMGDNILMENKQQRKKTIKNMLEKVGEELLRLSIELDVHARMSLLYENGKKQVYENKVKHIQDEIKYNENRKSILEQLFLDK